MTHTGWKIVIKMFSLSLAGSSYLSLVEHLWETICVCSVSGLTDFIICVMLQIHVTIYQDESIQPLYIKVTLDVIW